MEKWRQAAPCFSDARGRPAWAGRPGPGAEPPGQREEVRALLLSASSQLPSAQKHPNTKVTYLRVACSTTLHSHFCHILTKSHVAVEVVVTPPCNWTVELTMALFRGVLGAVLLHLQAAVTSPCVSYKLVVYENLNQLLDLLYLRQGHSGALPPRKYATVHTSVFWGCWQPLVTIG